MPHSPALRRRRDNRTRRLALEPLERRELLTAVTLNPVADNSIFSENTSFADGAGIYLFSGQAASQAGVRRALLKFDIASAVPAGATINSVSLRMNVSKSISGANNYSLNTIGADWGEGTSDATGEEGKGAAATAGSSTWAHRFFSTTPWATAGGVFNSTASATTSVSGTGFYTWTSAQLASDVQQWLATPGNNFGWMLKEVNETVEGSAKRFDSRESPASSQRPQLTIDYTAAVVNPNKAPTLDAIGDPTAILEGAGQQTINLSGISAGAGESQTITVTAISNNTALIPNPTVNYNSPNSTGSLTYTPGADRFGSATITVTVRDNGGTANGGVDTFIRTFVVNVTGVNDAPTVNALSNLNINEDASLQTMNLAGISAGPNESQTISISATSSDPTLIPNPAVSYASPNATGSISFTPIANAHGTATITVTVTDNGGTANGGVASFIRTFVVTVAPVNDRPTFTGGPNQGLVNREDPVNVPNWATNISAGPDDEDPQTLTFQLNNDNPALFDVPPTIDASGSLTFSGVPNAQGTANVTVLLHDNGGTANGGLDTSLPFQFTISFRASSAWHNPDKPLDVDDDKGIRPIDALFIINHLNAVGITFVPFDAPVQKPFLDTNNDGFVTPIDALLVINELNSGGGAEGEAPAADVAIDDFDIAWLVDVWEAKKK